MDELERMIQQDRATPIPDPPDVRYTVAAIRRQRSNLRRPAPEGHWPLLLAAPALAGGLALLTIHMGLSAWWLLLLPMVALTLTPILLDKGDG